MRTFRPPSIDEVGDLLARTAQPAATGEWEAFKTSDVHDGTAQNPEWLGLGPPA